MPYIFRLYSEPEGAVVDLTVNDNWSPTVSYDGSDVVESLPCMLTALTDDAQAANLQALHRIQENVRYYVTEPSSQHTQETWLEWSAADESLAVYAPRRRLVKAMDVAFDSGMWFNCSEGNVARAMHIVLTLRCEGWWELSKAQGILQTFNFALMTEVDITLLGGPLYGDAPARMNEILLSNAIGMGADDIYGAYIAFRSAKRHGDLDNFVPLWQLEDGAPVTDTAAVIQAGASPSAVANNSMDTDFTTDATFTARINIEFDDVTADFSDNYGRYLVLYRGQVDAGTTCAVRVDSRHATAGAVVPAPEILGSSFSVTNSATWRIFDTGLIVQLPPLGTHTGIDIQELYGFTVSASRTAGAGSLYSDCLIMVPIDELMIYYNFVPPVSSGVYVIALPGGDRVIWRTHFGPDETSAACILTTPSQYLLHAGTPYSTGDGLPPGSDTRAYVTTFNTTYRDNDYTDDFTILLEAYPRYHSLHGAG